MADGVDVRVVDRSEHPLRQTLGRLPKPAVQARGDPVEPGQQIVVVVQAAVCQDIDLAGFEDGDLGQSRVERVDFVPLAPDTVLVEAARHGQGLGVVADRDVLEAQIARCRDHRLERVTSVAPGRVRVEFSLQVADLDQVRKQPGGGGLDLASVLAQLRGDPRESERRVNLRLVVCPRGVFAGPTDPVLRDR